MVATVVKKRSLFRILMAVGLFAVAGIGAVVFFIWYTTPKNWGVVEPGRIYRSGLIRPGLVKQTLAENRIRVIVSLCSRNPEDPRDDAMEAAAKELGIEVLRFPMKGDGTAADGTMDLHVAAIEAICKARQAEKPVLIQCAAGAQRTGGVVATYQLLVERKTLQEVYAEMLQHNVDTRPDHPLLPFLNRNMKDAAEKLVAKGVIPSVPPDLTLPGGAAK
jgi:hypothetical protein